MRKAISVKGFQRRSRQFSLSILDRFGTSVLLIGSNFFTFNCKWYITTFDVPIICFTEIIQSWDFSNTISNFLTSNNYIPTSNAQLYSAVTKPQFDQITSSLAWWCFDELWFPGVVGEGGGGDLPKIEQTNSWNALLHHYLLYFLSCLSKVYIWIQGGS